MKQMIFMDLFGIGQEKKAVEFQPRPTDRPKDWLVAENNYGYNENSRGLGLLDLMKAVEEDREPRASGELSATS